MLHKVCVCEWFNILNEVKTFLSFENLLLSLISWVRTLAHGLYVIHWTQSGWLQGHCVPPKTALIPNVPMVFSFSLQAIIILSTAECGNMYVCPALQGTSLDKTKDFILCQELLLSQIKTLSKAACTLYSYCCLRQIQEIKSEVLLFSIPIILWSYWN